ncbi:MAG TPA: CATRA system-associated protein [Streptosporangiaceae bacterium]|nr:CATRA system-associated protein [Streptosporangiaceae bacterium]
MDPSDESPANWESGDVVDVRAEALDVVSDALQWRLAEARWQAIEQVLSAMDAALEADNLDALAAATADLELAGPLRITRIGATPVVPPAPPVRDRLNQLVHSLGGVPAAQHHEPEDAGADDDGASGS